jgi:uncharacterized protein (DUF1697 family)
MASVVFFRAVNVGLHQRFQPSALAKEMTDWGAVNVGAAGTLVVKENVTPTKLQSEILRRLPFKPELMICPAREVLALADGEPFGKMPGGKEVTAFVSVMQKAPPTLSPLPVDYPIGGKWEIRIAATIGRFILSFRRPGAKDLYTNAVVEKHFGAAATTRNWNTMTAIHKILAG